MTSLQGPYDDAYDPWPVEDESPVIDAGQGRTLDEVNASARVVEVCIVAALLLAALVWVLA